MKFLIYRKLSSMTGVDGKSPMTSRKVFESHNQYEQVGEFDADSIRFIGDQSRAVELIDNQLGLVGMIPLFSTDIVVEANITVNHSLKIGKEAGPNKIWNESLIIRRNNEKLTRNTVSQAGGNEGIPLDREPPSTPTPPPVNSRCGCKRVAKINPKDNPISVPDSFWNETKTIDGVKYHRHPNGGGFVAETATVDETAFVGMNAVVYGKAQIRDNAQVFGNAQVGGNAKVSGNARVYGNVCVFEDARVYEDAWVFGNAWVSGDARVFGDAKVFEYAHVYGEAQVCGNAQLSGSDFTGTIALKRGNYH